MGSSREVGIYSEICEKLGIEPLSFYAAQGKYGQEKAFEGACQEALEVAEKVTTEPLYDYILIDEAQDFPASFSSWSTNLPIARSKLFGLMMSFKTWVSSLCYRQRHSLAKQI